MSPRHSIPKAKLETNPLPKKGSGMDRDRHLKDAKHHPLDHPLPHPPHKTINKPILPRDHTTHTHPHEEGRGPHTDKPGLITPSQKISRPVTKK